LARVEKALTKMNELPQAADYRTLSLAAKVFQIVKGKDKMQVGDFGKEARRLGWKLTSSDVTKAADLLKQLGLVKVTQERPTGGPPKQTQPAA
jgi:RNA polymerase-interacting CarD/CdnL/TRCF family regulator